MASAVSAAFAERSRAAAQAHWSAAADREPAAAWNGSKQATGSSAKVQAARRSWISPESLFLRLTQQYWSCAEPLGAFVGGVRAGSRLIRLYTSESEGLALRWRPGRMPSDDYSSCCSADFACARPAATCLRQAHLQQLLQCMLHCWKLLSPCSIPTLRLLFLLQILRRVATTALHCGKRRNVAFWLVFKTLGMLHRHY